MSATNRSERDKVWRNLMVMTVNEALSRRLFSLEVDTTLKSTAPDEPDETTFRFEIDGLPALGYVRGIGFHEVQAHVVIEPKPSATEWIDGDGGFPIAFAQGSAGAAGWLERLDGKHLMWVSGRRMVRCANRLKARLANLVVEPRGYADHGRFVM